MDDEAAQSEAMRKMLDELWQRGIPVLEQRLDLLEVAAAAASAKCLPEDLRAQAITEAHKLAGSLGMFGYWAGTDLAREIEVLLDARLPAAGERLTALTMALRAELFPKA